MSETDEPLFELLERLQERAERIDSLSPAERDQLIAEINEVAEEFAEAFEPLAESLAAVMAEVGNSLVELNAAFQSFEEAVEVDDE